MKYLTLLSLEIAHDYYTDRRCPDFQIEPTPDTRKLLNGYRCVLKPSPAKLRILIAATDEDMPFIALPKSLVFAFHLRLLNPDFSLFTDLTELDGLAAPLYTNESPSAYGDLLPVSREAWGTEQFVIQEPASKEIFVLGGQPLAGAKVAEDFAVDGLGEKVKRCQYDVKTRTITVNTAKAEKPETRTPFTVTYPTTPRLEWGVFADVEIKYSPGKGTLLKNADPFRVSFKAKKARWKYYIVTDKSNGQTVLPSLEDKDKAVVFNASDRTDLTQKPDPADEIAVQLAKQYPNRRCFRFVSSQPIPCQQTVRKNIQFRLNGDKVINSLPNPALQNYCIDIRNAVREYSLYQIIQYFSP